MTSTSAYLSATKLVLLVAIDQYARHYDWGPEAQCDLAQFLVARLCEPSWAESWQDLRTALDAIAVPNEDDQTLRQLLCRRMDDIGTLDALHVFFDDLRLLVTSAGSPADGGELIFLDSESILGLFVRRCCLAFDQLEFHQTGVFFGECVRAFGVMQSGRNDASDRQAAGVQSRIELQEHLEHQIALLEAESGAPVPAEVVDQIQRAMAALPDHSRTHYLDYLNQVRTGESHQAETSLRRFFDSNVVKDNRTIYQYALLYLAAMRAQLGMLKPARLALTEATHVARDCQDHTCLLYIMFWEARLQLHSQSPGSRPQALNSLSALIDKAAAMRNKDVWAAGIISLADCLRQGEAPARRVFEVLVQAQVVLAEHDIGRLHGPWHLAVSRAWLHYSDSRSQEGAAAVWLALLHAQLALLGQQAPPSPSLTEHEHVQAICQRARVDAALCGPAAAAAALQEKILGFSPSALANPARVDDLQDTVARLQLEAGGHESLG
ncbi:hypothetical protein EV175_004822 [Coemansia sp. RSA 1933]|nr:hypothetical protein EV175_004822 [Coemansia sp. RSA 1933]